MAIEKGLEVNLSELPEDHWLRTFDRIQNLILQGMAIPAEILNAREQISSSILTARLQFPERSELDPYPGWDLFRPHYGFGKRDEELPMPDMDELPMNSRATRDEAGE